VPWKGIEMVRWQWDEKMGKWWWEKVKEVLTEKEMGFGCVALVLGNQWVVSMEFEMVKLRDCNWKEIM